MHKSSMKRMEWFAEQYEEGLRNKNVLDVGSYNVNGCYRKIFEEKNIKYTGLDMEKGPNVDITPESTYKWREIDSDSYTAVISGQALEHVEFFWITMEEIVRVTEQNGFICIIAPNGFKEHRYPVDCWRFFTDGMIALAKYYGLEILHAHTNCAPSIEDEEWFSEDEADSMLIAKKPYRGLARKVDLDGYRCEPIAHNQYNHGFVTYEEYKQARDAIANIGKKNRMEEVKASTRKRMHGRLKKSLESLKQTIRSWVH